MKDRYGSGSVFRALFTVDNSKVRVPPGAALRFVDTKLALNGSAAEEIGSSRRGASSIAKLRINSFPYTQLGGPYWAAFTKHTGGRRYWQELVRLNVGPEMGIIRKREGMYAPDDRRRDNPGRRRRQ